MPLRETTPAKRPDRHPHPHPSAFASDTIPSLSSSLAPQPVLHRQQEERAPLQPSSYLTIYFIPPPVLSFSEIPLLRAPFLGKVGFSSSSQLRVPDPRSGQAAGWSVQCWWPRLVSFLCPHLGRVVSSTSRVILAVREQCRWSLAIPLGLRWFLWDVDAPLRQCCSCCCSCWRLVPNLSKVVVLASTRF